MTKDYPGEVAVFADGHHVKQTPFCRVGVMRSDKPEYTLVQLTCAETIQLVTSLQEWLRTHDYV